MNSKGWTLGIIALASLALLAVAIAMVATPAHAVTGTPLPPDGSDWVIDQDTSVLGETIKLTGNIIILPGNTLNVRNSNVLMNCSYDGQYTFQIQTNSSHGDAKAIFNVSNMKAAVDPDNGWRFQVNGALDVDNQVKFESVRDGIRIFSDAVSINDMTLKAQGSHGIYVQDADPTIHNSEITVKGQAGSNSYGVYLTGSSMDMVAADLDGLTIKVYAHDETYYTSYYRYYSRFYLTGMYCYNAKFDTLDNIVVSMDATADVVLNYTGWSCYWYSYIYLTGFYFGGDTVINELDVEVSDCTIYLEGNGGDNPRYGYMRMYNYMAALENRIGSSGTSPNNVTGVKLKDIWMDYEDNNFFYTYEYDYSKGIEWYPSSSAITASTLIVEDLHFDHVKLGEYLDVTTSMDLVVQNNRFENGEVDDGIQYISSSNDVTYKDNQMINMSGNLFYYSGSGDTMFVDNNISMGDFNRLMYISYPSGEFTFEKNTIYGNKFQYLFYTYGNSGKMEFTENHIENNTGTDWAMRLYYTRADMAFEENTVYNNTFNGFFYSSDQRSGWDIHDNLFEDNSLGSRGIYWLYGYFRGELDITDNDIIKNSGSGKYFDFYGLGYWSSNRPFKFERNYFFNNTGSTATNSGLVYFWKHRQSFTVNDNEFVANDANCIVIDLNYFYYRYDNYQWVWTIEDNVFRNNTGKGIVSTRIDNCHIRIQGNTGSGNEDYCVYIDFDDYYVRSYRETDHARIYLWGYCQGYDSVTIESNNFSYNPGGAIHSRATYYSGSSYSGNPGQEVTVKKNSLLSNGPDGWTIYLDVLYNKPTVRTNRLTGAKMGVFYGLTTDSGRRQTFSMVLREEDWHGGVGGVTAYGFKEVDATIYDSSFFNYSTCFYAEDCELNVYWSKVPEASGETQGKGRIYIWNWLEIAVTWANASLVDSGIPVPDAVVALRGANEDYLPAMSTDEDGGIEPMLLNPWTCIDGEMDAWSPFRASVSAQGVSTTHDVHVIGDFLDPDPYRLTLDDIFVPEVIISNPQDGTLVNTPDVRTEGFLFEVGSGITTFQGRTDEMAEDVWNNITEEVLWEHVFEETTEGEHNISVRAGDLSGNWNKSVINIIVDLTKPDLRVHLEYLNETPIPWDPVKGGYFVRDDEIIIKGNYSDNYAGLGEVAIRVNGVPEFIFPGQWGKINKRVGLDEGINTFIVDATDTANNRMERRLYVTLDSYPPTMYIYNPLQGEKTANETMEVTGLTEPLTRLDIVVQSSAGTNSYRHLSDEDGTFMFPVDLFEGIQKILVTATDSAGNPTVQFRDVTLDTTPPDFIINQPEEEHTVTNKVRFTILGTMTFDPNAIVTIGGQEVVNTGVFSREVVLQEDENRIEIVAVDEVGNERSKWVTIVRDTIPPVLEVTSPEVDDLITNQVTIGFRGSVMDSDGVVIVHKSIPLEAELTNGTWDEGEWMYDLELGEQDLEQDIEVKAIDMAGNEDVWVIHVRLDIVPPVLRIDDVPEQVHTPFAWINGTTDTNIPFVQVQSVPYAVTDGTFSIQWSLAAGSNRITVMVEDEAGNQATETIDVEYMYTPPEKPEGPEGPEGTNWYAIFAIALILVMIVILVVVLVVTRARSGGR